MDFGLKEGSAAFLIGYVPLPNDAFMGYLTSAKSRKLRTNNVRQSCIAAIEQNILEIGSVPFH
jgi:hypothetical protein